MKRKVLFILLLSLLLLIGFYTALYGYIYYASKEYFLEDKFAKSIHMDYRFNHKSIDYIFIGSSITQNHISTHILQEYNLSIYNYGRPLVYLLDMPYMVHQALKKSAKYIVIDLDILELYKPNLDFTFHTLFDYHFINHAIDTHYQFKSINEALYSQFKLKDIIRQIYDKKSSKQIDRRVSRYTIETTTDCNVTNFRGSQDRTVFLCSNGDGFIVAKQRKYDSPKVQKLDKSSLSPMRLALLNAMIDYIKANQKIPIVLFNASHINTYKDYDINYLKDAIHTPYIIDNSNYNIYKERLWADHLHFNIKGREEYSHHLAKQLGELFDK